MTAAAALWNQIDSVVAALGKEQSNTLVVRIMMANSNLELKRVGDLAVATCIWSDGYETRKPLFYMIRGQAPAVHVHGQWEGLVEEEVMALDWELADDLERLLEEYGYDYREAM